MMDTKSKSPVSPLTCLLQESFPDEIINIPFHADGANWQRYRSLRTKVDRWFRDTSLEDETLNLDHLSQLKSLGLFGISIPTEYGGLEFDQTTYCRFAEHLYGRSPTVALTVGAHASIAVQGLLLFGNASQKRKYLPSLATGERIGAFCLTEEEAGADVRAIETTAERQGDTYLINGKKIFATNGNIASFMTVFAKEVIEGVERLTAFLVTTDMPGITQTPGSAKMGIRAVDMGTIDFHNVTIPAENVLGLRGDGFRVAMTVLNHGRQGLAAGYVGSMKEIFAQSLQYAKNRRTFGIPLIDNQAIQEMLVTMKDNIFSAESMVYLSATLAEQGYDLSLEATLNKVFTTEAAWQCADMGMQIHGGLGYMTTHPMERHLRDNRIGRIFAGTNDVLRLFAGMKGIKTKSRPLLIHQRVMANSKESPWKRLAATSHLISLSVEGSLGRLFFEVPTERIHRSLTDDADILADTIKVMHQAAAHLVTLHRRGTKLARAQVVTLHFADILICVWRSLAVLVRISAVLRDRGVNQSDIQRRAKLETARRILRFSLRKATRRLDEIREWNPAELETATAGLQAHDDYAHDLFP